MEGSYSKYGRLRKLNHPPGFCVLSKEGRYVDVQSPSALGHNSTSTVVSPSSSVKPALDKPQMCELHNPTETSTALVMSPSMSVESPADLTRPSAMTEETSLAMPLQDTSSVTEDLDDEDIRDDISNEENMPIDHACPLEEQMFVDSALFIPDAPPSLKTYKRKFQPLGPTAVLTPNPKLLHDGKLDTEAGKQDMADKDTKVKRASHTVVKPPAETSPTKHLPSAGIKHVSQTVVGQENEQSEQQLKDKITDEPIINSAQENTTGRPRTILRLRKVATRVDVESCKQVAVVKLDDNRHRGKTPINKLQMVCQVKLQDMEHIKVCTSKQQSLVVQQQSPAAQQQAPAAQQQAPAAQQQSPVAQQQAPVAQKQAPAAQKQTPAAQKQTPAAQKQAPAAQKQTPAAQKQTPATQKQTPASQKQTPAAQKQTPAAQEQAPAAQEQAPAAQKQTPAAQEQTPAAQEQAPAAQQQAPVMHQQAPAAQQQNLAKQPIFDEALKIGDLVWARMSGNAPFWPALITRDAKTQDFYHPADSGPRSVATYHVSFYGSQSVNCAAWTQDRHILPYLGSDKLDFSNTIFKQRLGSQASKIHICGRKDSYEKADTAMQQSSFERIMNFASWIEQLKVEKLESRKKQKVARETLQATVLAAQEQPQDVTDSALDTGNGVRSPTVKSESRPIKRSRPDSLDSSSRKRLRLSSPSPPRQKTPEPSEVEEKSKPNSKKPPPPSSIIINMKYEKRRLAGVTAKVCDWCLLPGKMSLCPICRHAMHKTCGSMHKGTLVCKSCARPGHPCQLCGDSTKKLIACTSKPCTKRYHPQCLKGWHQAKQNFDGTLICPNHTCHTCVSDDPGSQRLYVPPEHLIHCLFCPTAYHAADTCIPAAAHVFSNAQCICPKHTDKLQKRKPLVTYNTNWCFTCTKGGILAVCDSCPTAYHPTCIERSSVASSSNHCAECESGSFPICGQIVWAKHSNYRWWPARVAFPDEVPHLYEGDTHNYNEFVVQFLGSKDLAWSNNRRVFPYIHEDTKKEQQNKLTKGTFGGKFKLGVKEAAELFIQHREQQGAARKLLHQRPPLYQWIKSNRIVNSRVRSKMQEMVRLDTEGSDRCTCSPKDQNPCGFGTGCLNRDLCVECDTDCPAGELCENRLFSKGVYAPVRPVLTPRCGWGLEATEDIKEGDFVIEYVGDLIDDIELQSRISEMHELNEKNFYFLAVEGQLYIDAGPRGNAARFMNHSCEPNCKADKWLSKNELRMGLFALKDIPKETELTFDYNLKLFGENIQHCFCGADSCVGFIGNKLKAKAKTSKAVKTTDSNKQSTSKQLKSKSKK